MKDARNINRAARMFSSLATTIYRDANVSRVDIAYAALLTAMSMIDWKRSGNGLVTLEDVRSVQAEIVGMCEDLAEEIEVSVDSKKQSAEAIVAEAIERMMR